MLKSAPSTKRPPDNPDAPQNVIKNLLSDLTAVKDQLESFAQHLRALDRRRLNGVGIKKWALSDERSEVAAVLHGHDRASEDPKGVSPSSQSADVAYTDALEFYASVREAPGGVATNKSIIQTANMPVCKSKILYAE